VADAADRNHDPLRPVVQLVADFVDGLVEEVGFEHHLQVFFVLRDEDCAGCGLQGWGWQDNGWGTGVMGPELYFGTTGPQTLRIQSREDGLSIDQILLSPSLYLNASPGALKNDATILAEASGG